MDFIYNPVQHDTEYSWLILLHSRDVFSPVRHQLLFSLQTNRSQGAPWYQRGKAAHIIHIPLKIIFYCTTNFSTGKKATFITSDGVGGGSISGLWDRWKTQWVLINLILCLMESKVEVQHLGAPFHSCADISESSSPSKKEFACLFLPTCRLEIWPWASETQSSLSKNRPGPTPSYFQYRYCCYVAQVG